MTTPNQTCDTCNKENANFYHDQYGQHHCSACYKELNDKAFKEMSGVFVILFIVSVLAAITIWVLQ